MLARIISVFFFLFFLQLISKIQSLWHAVEKYFAWIYSSIDACKQTHCVLALLHVLLKTVGV